MTKATTFTKGALDKAIKSFKDAGLPIGGVKVEADGGFTVLVGDALVTIAPEPEPVAETPAPEIDPFAEWKRKHEERQAKRARKNTA